jgi:zinc-binding alcohol dehydrogenase/oxidoreductase
VLIRAGKHCGALGRIELAPFAGGEVAEEEFADARADEAQRRMPDRGRHTAHLAVFSFDQCEREPAIGDGFAHTDRRIARRDFGLGIKQARPAGQGAIVVDHDAAAGELGDSFGGRHALDLRPVFAAVRVSRIEEAGVEAGFVAEEKQALAVGIESTERVDPGGQAEVGERTPFRAGLGRELREDAVGFVKREQHGAELGGAQGCPQNESVADAAERALVGRMQALQLAALNQLAVVDLPAPVAATGEVVVTLQAAALNHRDVWIKLGQYAGLKYPAQPGSDGAGKVTALGEGVEAEWLGREVIINPSFGWGASEAAFGPEFTILGLPRDGTLAQQIAVPVTQLALKPGHLSWQEAAALPLAGLTAYRALFARAQLRAGDKILISGIGGGVALFALQFAVAQGAEVWVTSSSEEKIAKAVALGARGGFDYTVDGWAKTAAEKLPGGGFDVIVDSAGGPGFEHLIDLAVSGARIVFFGATRGNPPVLPTRKVFWRNISLLGTTMGSPADWRAMLEFVSLHRIVPVVSDTFPLAHVGEAFDLMERGGQFGKIVITM